MKKVFFILISTVLCYGCTIDSKPEFLGIDKIRVERASIDSITLNADALFNNLNDLGGTLLTDEIKVFIDDVYIAKVSSVPFNVPARDKFTVPLKVDFSTYRLIQEDKGGLLGTILKQVLNKKVVVNFKGDLTYRLAGFSYDYPIDHREEIHIK